ncbi:MAG: LLM class F420-dependent oxidoreductase [Acidimicrobiia bacterium]
MAKIRIAVQLHPQQSEYSAIREAALRYDEAGVDIIYNWDHFFPLYGDPHGAHFECWTMLASLAEVTRRAEIGALVTCNSYRNPQLLADMARTVDHISDGRLILGIGSGWYRRDYDEYGYEFGTAASRLRDLDANLPLIKDRLAKLNPPPIREIPILVGGGGEKVTLRITAQHADAWHGYGKPKVIARKNQILDTWCAKVGRDPSAIERACGIRTGSDPSRGSRYVDAGATQLAFGLNGPDYQMPHVADWIAWRDDQNKGPAR